MGDFLDPNSNPGEVLAAAKDAGIPIPAPQSQTQPEAPQPQAAAPLQTNAQQQQVGAQQQFNELMSDNSWIGEPPQIPQPELPEPPPQPPMPTAKPMPQAPTLPAATPPAMPGIPELKRTARVTINATPAKEATRQTEDFSSILGREIGYFGHGALHGVRKIFSELNALGELAIGPDKQIMAGMKRPHPDWQSQDEAATPKQEAQSIGHKIGDVVGSTAAMSGIGIATGGVGGALGMGAAGSTALGVGTSAAEGAVYSAAQRAREAGGKPVSGVDLAAHGLGGAALGAVGGAAAIGLGALVKKYGPTVAAKIAGRFMANRDKLAKVKQLREMFKAARDAQELFDHAELALMQSEKKQLESAAQALKTPVTNTLLANKQREVMQANDDAVNNMLLKLYKTTDEAEHEALLKQLRKALPGNNNAQIIKRAQQLKANMKASGSPPAGAAEPDAQFRKFLAEGGEGYGRIAQGTPLDDVVSRLPKPLGKALSSAVHEIGKVEALVAHLKNQVEAYGDNALNHATSAEQLAKIHVKTEPVLRRKARIEADKQRELIWREQGAEYARLKDEADGLRKQFEDKAATKEARQKLLGQINRLQKRLAEFKRPEELLNVSSEKHVAGLVDRHVLPPSHDKLSNTFDGAYKQFEEADALLQNAKQHLKDLKEKNKPVFEQAEAASNGERHSLRVSVSHPKFTGETEASIGLHFDPSVAHLIGRFKKKHARIIAGLESIEENVVHKTVFSAARKLRITAAGAEKMLADKKLIHPTAKAIIAAGALGLQAMNNPAEAADLSKMDKKQREKYFQNWGVGLGISAAMVATILARKHGPAGGKLIAASARFMIASLYQDMHDLVGSADRYLGRTGVQDSLAHALNEWRGKLLQMHLLCSDDRTLVLKHLNHTATAADTALLSPDGHRYLRQVQDLEARAKDLADDFHQEWSQHVMGLSTQDRLALMPVSHAVKVATDLFKTTAKEHEQAPGDWAINKLFAQFARAQFTLNPKVMGAALIHDLGAVGSLQVGPAAMYKAVGDYLGNSQTRGLMNKITLGGQATHAIQQANAKAPPLVMEQLQSQIMGLASLNRQWHIREPELRALGVTSLDDFVQKTMTGRMPEHAQDYTFQLMALDISRGTGGDPLHLNGSVFGKNSPVLGAILKYTQQPMREQRLWKENAQQVVNSVRTGEFGAAMQRAGWMGHALLVKQQYAGGKAVIPAGLTAALQNQSFSSDGIAQALVTLNNLSIGMHVLGDGSDQVKWDPLLGPLMGVATPAVQEVFDAGNALFVGSDKIGVMADTLSNGGTFNLGKGASDLATGSKEDEDIAKGQAALKGLITLSSLVVPVLKGGVPTRAVANALFELPNILHNNVITRVRSTLPVGEMRMIEGAKVQRMQGNSTQQALDTLNHIKKGLGMGRSLEEANYEIARQAAKTNGDSNVSLQLEKESRIW